MCFVPQFITFVKKLPYDYKTIGTTGWFGFNLFYNLDCNGGEKETLALVDPSGSSDAPPPKILHFQEHLEK